VAPIELSGVDGGVVGVVRDITRRKRIEDDLAATTERFETLIDASPLAIVATDGSGIVERWNPAAEEMFGWTSESVVGDLLPIVPPESRDRMAELHERVLDGERLTNVDVTLQRLDGDRFDASASVAPIADPDDSIEGIVLIVADVTDRVEQQKRLERQNERLDEFASLVSHDLRTPLQVARGNVELAAENPEHLSTVAGALDRMEVLLEDLLTLAREGRDIDRQEPVDAGGVARRAWSTVATGDATLRVGNLPTVEGDESRLLELFENLFRNAMEHAAPRPDAGTDPEGRSADGGGVPEEDLTVTLGALSDRQGFFVADDGPGIPAADRDSVFEPGYTTAEDGTGFGLSIVRTIAEAHGWEVAVTESQDGGARFELLTDPRRAPEH